MTWKLRLVLAAACASGGLFIANAQPATAWWCLLNSYGAAFYGLWFVVAFAKERERREAGHG